MHGITVNCEDRVLEVTLPCLLPKRRQRQSDEFLLDPLYFVLNQYAREHPLPHYRDCVVCFTQVYDRALPNRQIRDYDNLSEKQLLDLLSSFVMADDIRHYDVTGKLCPRPWCCADMNVYYKTSGDAQWEEFKKRISDGKEEDEDMTLDTFKELMKEYRAELQDNDCGTWSKEAREWAISNGLINGTGTEVNGEPNYAWADQLTREQAAALFYRFAKLMGKA